MKYALNLAEDNCILSATFERFASGNYVIVNTLPDGNISDYRYENGEFVYDPLPVEDVDETPSAEDTTLELLADHEYRLCMLELNS